MSELAERVRPTDVVERPRITRSVILRISDSWLNIAVTSLLCSNGIRLSDTDSDSALIVTDNRRHLSERTILITELNAATAHGVMSALNDGKLGAVVSRADPRHLISVIAAVDSGMTVIPQELIHAAATFKYLGPRHLRVLTQITAGMSNRQIAKRLAVSEPTIKRDVSLLLEVFDCKTRVQLVLEACRAGY